MGPIKTAMGHIRIAMGCNELNFKWQIKNKFTLQQTTIHIMMVAIPTIATIANSTASVVATVF